MEDSQVGPILEITLGTFRVYSELADLDAIIQRAGALGENGLAYTRPPWSKCRFCGATGWYGTSYVHESDCKQLELEIAFSRAWQVFRDSSRGLVNRYSASLTLLEALERYLGDAEVVAVIGHSETGQDNSAQVLALGEAIAQYRSDTSA